MSMRKIMVVDDEPVIGRLLTYQLHGFGYDVCYVQDGLRALERVLLEEPDLILLDVMMPLVSGWEVCRQIRETSSIPIIMLTGKNADSDIVTGLQSGADDYITKPFSVPQLQARIEAVLRRVERAPLTRSNATFATAPYAAVESTTTHALVTVLPEPTVRNAAAQPSRHPSPRQAAGRSSDRVTVERLTASAAEPPAPRVTQHLGQRMREVRQRRGISLYQAERACRIRWEFLQAIEQENWSYLPHHQLRPAVMAYTGFLGLDPQEVTPRLPPSPPAFHLPLATAALVLMVLLVVGLSLL
jgi:DNA-binding response OmpR family regulator